jgi:hypothetical protein
MFLFLVGFYTFTDWVFGAEGGIFGLPPRLPNAKNGHVDPNGHKGQVEIIVSPRPSSGAAGCGGLGSRGDFLLERGSLNVPRFQGLAEVRPWHSARKIQE